MTIVEKVLALQDVDLFSQVSTDALAHLAAIAQEETYETNDVIFRENDAADTLHLVLSGRVQMSHGGRVITSISAGEVLGTWALLDTDSRVATATVTEPSHCLLIERADFFDLIADNLEITQGVLRSLVGRVRKLLAPRSTGDTPSAETA